MAPGRDQWLPQRVAPRARASPSAMPSLWITASAAARRAARGRLLGDDARAPRRSVQPERAHRRARSATASAQSTTQTRSTRPRQRPDSTSSGTSKTSSGAVAGAAAWRSASAPISGCRMPSRRRFGRGVGERQRRACAARSSAPSASMKSAPKAARIGVDGRAAGQRQLRARSRRCRSASAPSATSSAATVLLPLPMPPVRPMRRRHRPCMRRRRSGPAEPAQHAIGCPAKQRRPARRRRGRGRRARSGLRAGRRTASCAMPTTAPITEAPSTIGSSICQPSQAPSAASSLKSPKPMPSLPVVSLNSQ